eukprot:m.29158 g.29158  ORF g.29158 m.29158 type:complete len:220 (+) comp31139_c0_seq6:27-686(+)
MACPLFSGEREKDEGNGEGGSDLHYLDYLKIPELLQLQQPLSRTPENPKGVHDEHLFILIHQVYELWFRQILHELDSIMEILKADILEESLMLVINSRANRIMVILRIAVEQIKVLETMTPLDFLDFRHFLSQSSGFQSLQFRLVECKLGVREVPDPPPPCKALLSWHDVNKGNGPPLSDNVKLVIFNFLIFRNFLNLKYRKRWLLSARRFLMQCLRKP